MVDLIFFNILIYKMGWHLIFGFINKIKEAKVNGFVRNLYILKLFNFYIKKENKLNKLEKNIKIIY